MDYKQKCVDNFGKKLNIFHFFTNNAGLNKVFPINFHFHFHFLVLSPHEPIAGFFNT